MRRVTVVHDYPVPPQQVWALVSNYDSLQTVMRGKIAFADLPAGDIRQGDDLALRVSLFGLFPWRPYKLRIETCDAAAMHLQSREAGLGLCHWAHRIEVIPHNGGARLTDIIDIDAGWKTPIVSAFATWMLRARHRPRLRLLGLA
ncbi:MAG: SRPBCC family protein [Paracoccaceae bacterium]|nr:SRPBCC family protein [Paracoccaceae bacterium]